ncbi:MAG: DUF4911 domain-containing protein [Deltaproteobacteria bacterium]|nr:MAG: DUF4911 domain-containing protein [Deltaproteobacteria bacterium]
MRDTLRLRVQVPRREIAYFNFLLESYEGLASVRTIDPQQGILELMVPPELKEELLSLLEAMKEEMELRCSEGDLLEPL